MDIDTAERLAGQIESKELTLRDLFASDPKRAEKMTVSAAGWTLDYSKNLVDEPTLKLLLKLAEKADLKAEIERMFTGEHINRTENRAVLHTALRSAKTSGLVVDGQDVYADVHKVLGQMGDFSDLVRSGKWKGATGKRIIRRCCLTRSARSAVSLCPTWTPPIWRRPCSR